MEKLTANFREALAEVCLEAPSPIPGGSQQIDFVEVLGRANLDNGSAPVSLASTLGRLLSATHVTYSYQVNGSLYQSQESGCSVTVQVIVLPKWVSQSITCTERNFEDAIKRAAYEVCAFILPLTKLVEKPPWAAWHSVAIPYGLFSDVQEAQKYKLSRRYDEALGKYFDAVKQDPHNPFIRLEVGFIQEQLGMYLDALMTYERVIKLGLNKDLERLAWIKGIPTYFRKKGPHKSWWRAALLTARYRQAILLGMGEPLTRDWCSGDQSEHSKRADELQRLRSQVHKILMPHKSDFQAYLWDHDGDGGGAEILRAEGVRISNKWDEYLLQELFQFVGQMNAQKLCHAYRFRKVPGGAVSRVALRLALVWAPARRSWTRQIRRDMGDGELAELKYPRAYGQSCFDKMKKSSSQVLLKTMHREWKWPLSARHIHREIRIAWLRGVPLRRSSWHDFYYSACIFAIGLLPLDMPDRSKEGGHLALTERAIKYLDMACQHADSSSIASMRSWIVAEDPDLVGLRTRPEFTDWENEHFPVKNPMRIFPKIETHDLEMIKYQHDLVKKVATLMTSIWEGREKDLGSSLHTDAVFERWSKEERAIWEMARNFLADRHHWQTRFDFIKTVQNFARDNSCEFEHSCPNYGEDGEEPVLLPAEAHHSYQQEVHESRKRRMDDLANLLSDDGQLKLWIGFPSRRPSDTEHISRLCFERAHRWKELAQEFSENPTKDSVKGLRRTGWGRVFPSKSL
ncbi:tetratricopeptide repeat protein [Streptomyces sp. NPDC059757]|uniref:tetratricopeptide repeat protein n=1 Tax=Streptomyces sp. NPDC059757 TaxID=3346935 RepID=UPI00364D18DA